MKDDNNKDNVVYQIQFKVPSNTKQLYIQASITKIQEFSDEEKIFIDVIEGDINSPKYIQSFSKQTEERDGTSFSCNNINYYPQSMDFYAQAYEGNFFIRIRLAKNISYGSSNKNQIFGLSKLIVEAQLADDIQYASCVNNKITECSQSGMRQAPTLKYCVKNKTCNGNGKPYYNFDQNECKQQCEQQEQITYIASDGARYCFLNKFICNELKFGPCQICDQYQTQCGTCYQDYELKNGICVRDDGNCSQTQFYDESSRKCIDCSQTLQNCNYCANSKQCVVCAPGYYITQKALDGTEFICQKCPQGCSKCQFADSCKTCDSTYELVNGVCKLLCASTQYEDNGKCVDCSNKCQTCTSGTNCTQCMIGYLKKEGFCVNTCGDGYFPNINVCEKCNRECSKCLSINVCTECAVGYEKFVSNCYQNCQTGQYRDPTTKNCMPCSSNCVSCTSQDDCSSCQNSYLLQSNTKCVTSCEIGYYQKDSKCMPCMNKCDMCVSPTNCLQCKNGFEFILQIGSCQTSCQSNIEFRSQIDLTKCEKCQNAIPNCQNCKSNIECTSCINNTKLQEGNCVATCSIGYYNDLNVCKKCIENCKACSNSSQCTTCVDGYDNFGLSCFVKCQQNQFREGSPTCQNCMDNCEKCTNKTSCDSCSNGYEYKSNQCIKTCSQGQYLKDKTCQQCMAGCIQCSDIDNCSICQSDNEVIQGKCYLKCQQNQFRNPINQKCTNCTQNCLKCSSLTTCDQCNNNFVPNNDKCFIVCPKGLYTSNDGAQCLPCPTSCTECSSQLECSQCRVGYILDQKQCKIQCTPSTFRVNDNQCDNCPQNCQDCKNQNECISCKTGYILEQFQCKIQCSSTQYRVNNNQCENCPQNCSACKSLSECISCKNGYQLQSNQCACLTDQYLNGNQCQQCMLNCKSCINGTSCDQCLDSTFDYINQKCQQKCILNQFLNQITLKCENCNSNCLQCNSNLDCNKCQTGYDLYKGECLHSCQLREYRKDKLCVSCPEGCSSCTSSTECQACDSSYEIGTQTKICLKTCNLGQFRKTPTTIDCDNCSQNCYKCTSQNDCSECQGGYFLQDNSKCVDQCRKGTYKDKNTCKSCPSKCSSCTSDTTCNGCQSSQDELVNGRCIKKCSSNQFREQISQHTFECKNCTSNCAKCNSLSYCISCENRYFLQNGLCTSGCQQGYYILNQQCEKCTIQGCLDCKSSDTCILCQSNYDLINHKCEIKCSQTQFRNSSNKCVECSLSISNCTKCDSSGTSCLECSNKLQENICVSSCDSRYYESSPNQCLKCIDNCEVCNNSTQCIACLQGYNLTNNKTCLPVCQLAEYFSGTQCELCPNNCSKCLNSNECTECYDSVRYEIVEKNCLPKCLSNEYRNKNFECQKCPKQCSKCLNDQDCFECNQPYQQAGNKCLFCGEREFIDFSDNTCKLCSQYMSNCLTCSSKNKCDKCDQNTKEINNLCYNQCADNQFRNSLNECISCMDGCLRCSQEKICDVCDESKKYYKDFNQICKYKVSYCGDGILTPSKECDDINQVDGDGCDKNCKIEKGYICEYDTNVQKSICDKVEKSKEDYNNFKIKGTSPLAGDQMPIVTIFFSKPLSLQDQNQDEILKSVQIEINNYSISKDYTVNCVIKSNTQVELHFQMKRVIKNKDIKVSFIDKGFLERNKFNKVDDFISENDKFPDYSPIDQDTKQQTQAVKTMGEVVSTSIVSSIIPIILFSNFSLLFNTLDLFQMIFYLRYVNIRHPYNIISFLDIFQAFNFPYSPNINDSIQGESNGFDNNGLSLHLNGPFKYTQSDYDCLFLANAGQDITQYLIILGIHIILRILCISRVNPISCIRNYIYKKVKTGWEWGWHIDCLWESYLGFVVSSFIAYFEIFNNPSSDSLSVANYFLSIVFNLLIFIIPISFTLKIYKNSTNLDQEQFKDKWGMLFEGIKLSNQSSELTDYFNNSNNSVLIKKNYLKVVPLQQQKSENSEMTIPEKLSHSILDEDSSPMQTHHEKNLLKQELGFSPPTSKINNGINIQTNSQLKSQQNVSSSIQPSSRDLNQVQQPSLSKLNKDYFKVELNISKYCKYYYCILYFRKLFFGLFIVFLHNTPLAQLLLLDFLNISIFLFIVVTKPYLNYLENIKSSICEMLIIVAQSCLKVLIKDDEGQSEDDRLKIGWVFISACCCILFIQLSFLLYGLLEPLYQKLKTKCASRKKNKIQPENVLNLNKTNSKETDLSFNKITLPQNLNMNNSQILSKSNSLYQQKVSMNQKNMKQSKSHFSQFSQTTKQTFQDSNQDNSSYYIKRIEARGQPTDINLTDNNQMFQSQDDSHLMTFRQTQNN